ncbi:MAG: hypothetical protein GY765_39965 [bacterium]|nr:hypothetical protein [bacterium]
MKKFFIFILVFVVITSLATAGSIHEAALQGKIDSVKKMIASTPELLHAVNLQGRTPLHIAAQKGQLQLMKWLIAKGADINQKEKSYQLTPLHMAAWAGNIDAARILLENKADFYAREKDNETPIFYAVSANLDMVKFLVKKGANIKDGKSIKKQTPLVYAVGSGKTDIVAYLLEKGADASVKTERGLNMVQHAVWRGSPQLLDLLVKKGVPTDVKTEDGSTPLLTAARAGKLDMVTYLAGKGGDIQAASKNGFTPLLYAAQKGADDIAAFLLEKGAKTTAVLKSTGRNALHQAALCGYGSIVKRLLEKGANVNSKDLEGNTPLYYAARYGHKNVAGILKSYKADTSALKNVTPSKALLTKNLKKGEALVFYLLHSGYAVKTQNHLLVFDYWENGKTPDTPGLSNGYLLPEEIAGLKVTFFSSHDHGDHYFAPMFDMKKKLKDVTYVLGHNPPDKKDYIFMGPREKKIINGFKVSTVKSTDSGVAFYVHVDGVKILHSGDHANMSRELNGLFRKEIDYWAAENVQPDLFFVPVSGCSFRDKVALKKGFFYVHKTLKPKVIFPMHAGHHEQALAEFADQVMAKGVTTPFCCPGHSGDWFAFKSGGKVKNAYLAKAVHKNQKVACKKKAACSQ